MSLLNLPKFCDKAKRKQTIQPVPRSLYFTPGKAEDITIVMGVNEDKYDQKQTCHFNASCTSNDWRRSQSHYAGIWD